MRGRREPKFGRGTGCCELQPLEIGARGGLMTERLRAPWMMSALYDLLALATNDGAAPGVRAMRG